MYAKYHIPSGETEPDRKDSEDKALTTAWKPGLLKLEDAITRYMVSVPRGRNSKSVKVLAV